jgi:hypothetical protein
MRFHRFSGFAVIASALLMAQSAAASGDMFRGSGLKPGEAHSGRVMTVDELDACLGVEADIRTLDSEITHAEMLRSLDDSRYRGLGHRISTEEQFLDKSDAKAVEHFNELVRELQQLVDSLNAQVEPINARLDRHAVAVERFNTECAAYGYNESDMLKARSARERRLAFEIDARKRVGQQ